MPLNPLLKLTWTETKLYIREPSAAFFTLAFPLLLLLLFGGIYGNEPADMFGGRGFLDIFVPALIGFIAVTSAFLGISQTLATYRDQGVLRRYRASPLHPGVLSAAAILMYAGITAVGAIVMVAVGHIVYGVALPEQPLSLALAALLATLTFLTMGLLLGSVAPTPRTAEAVGMVIYFPMIFLSGAVGIPREIMPELMQRLTELLPLTHAVDLLRSLWLGGGWDLTAVTVLVGVAVVSAAISVRVFRWE
jgi:ABC-2 type transport system permease protein